MVSLNPIELSIIMPCLNEEKTLASCIEKAYASLKSMNVEGEIVIADNGSTDKSCQIAEMLGARVVRVAEKGYGSALMGGIRAAKGRYIIMGDSDDSYDFSSLEGFMECFRNGFDLVMGNRFKGGIEKGAMPFLHRYFGNPILSFLGRKFCNIPIGDFHCGLRGFNKEKILTLGLTCSGMEFASELIVKAASRGLKITEIPIKLSKDGRDRAPHLRSFRDGWRHLRFLLLATPKWLFFYPGLFLSIFSSIFFATILATPLNLGAVVLDVHSLVYFSAGIIAGIQMTIFSSILIRMAECYGLQQASNFSVNIRRLLTFESAIVVGAIFIFVGLIVGFNAFSGWSLNDFGPMEPKYLMRRVIPSALIVMVGLQIVLGGALVAGMDIIESSARAAR